MAERAIGSDGKRRSPPTDRVVGVVETLGRANRWLSLAEIVTATRTTPPTCLSILRSLVDANWVVRHERDRRYRLGPALRRVAARDDYWTIVAQDVCTRLGADLGYECAVMTAFGSDLTTLEDWVPNGVDRPSLKGSKMPFAAPLGAALAAVLPAPEQLAWLRRGKEANPKLDTRRLEQALAGIRERGFNIYHPQAEHYGAMIISQSSGLHYPTVRALLAMTEQPFTSQEFDQLGSVDVGTVSAAVAAPSGLAVSVAVTNPEQSPLSTTRCLAVGRMVREAADQIGQALDEPTSARVSEPRVEHGKP